METYLVSQERNGKMGSAGRGSARIECTVWVCEIIGFLQSILKDRQI